MKKKLTNELGLKILAVVLSFLLWLIVANINDPIIEEDFDNIPVKIINQSILTEQGKVYEVLNDSDVVDISVKGPRSIVSILSKDDIIAVADLKEISFIQTIRIQASTTKDKKIFEEIKVKESQENLQLSIENKRTTQLEIESDVIGEVKKGYMLGTVSTGESIVQLSGPESAVNSVKRAIVTVDVSGMSSTIKTSYQLKLYDKDNKVIENQSIKKNITDDLVNVTANILPTKEVPLVFSTMGEVENGYKELEPIEYNPSSVIIAGSESALNEINELIIPETALDISGLKANYEAILNIEKYLPAGIVLDERKNTGQISVTVPIEQIVEKSIIIRPEEVQILNVPEGYMVSVASEDNIEATLFGTITLMEHIETYMQGSVDIQLLMNELEIEELKEEVYSGKVDLNLSPGIELIEDISVEILVEEIN